MNIPTVLSQKFGIKESYCENIIALLDEGCTVPFIARYRKEMHGSCDDQTIRDFADSLNQLRNLDKRKEEVVKLLTEQGNLTDEIKKQIDDATTVTEVEDIYRPFRPKRKTRASVAIAAGLQPLADALLWQDKNLNVVAEAEKYIDAEKGIENVEQALQGASDIIAEIVADEPNARKALRDIYFNKAKMKTAWVAEKDERKVYETYKEYCENIKTMPSHRILAINRGEKEGVIKAEINLDEKTRFEVLTLLCKQFAKGTEEIPQDEIYVEPQKDAENDKKQQESSKNEQVSAEKPKAKTKKEVELLADMSARKIVTKAVIDGYDRLLNPSLERELRSMLTDTADEQAIKMFESNLKPLLMQPPLKGKTVMAVDPAYRTGCKIAVVDANGNV
ncbi:MAG: hypothetical protein IJZ26_02155, partial [Clostridia bacterium]|nr:hypothetical protein [Clostridia bacterium]